jgi:hypothetical protein
MIYRQVTCENVTVALQAIIYFLGDPTALWNILSKIVNSLIFSRTAGGRDHERGRHSSPTASCKVN